MLFKTVSDEESIKRGRPKLAASFILSQTCDVACWHEAEMPKYLGDVRCWVNNGSHLLALSFSGFDPQLIFRNELIGSILWGNLTQS